MKKVNLLEETIHKMQDYGKNPKNVLWIGSKDGKYAINWEKFVEIADRLYMPDSEVQLIAKDLVIVGDDWWLERKEYNGGEWWNFVQTPKKKECKPFDTVFTSDVGKAGWLNIDEIDERKKGKK